MKLYWYIFCVILFQEPHEVKCKTSLVIEVLGLVDHSVYKSFQTKTDADGYYLQVFKELNKIFTSIKTGNYSYEIQVSGLKYFENALDSITEKNEYKVGEELNYEKALSGMEDWVKKNKDGLPEYDALLFFTKYRSHVETGSQPANADMCDEESMGLILDNGVFGTAEMAAFSLGTLLGSGLDGSGNTCVGNNENIMSKKAHRGYLKGVHTFSPCSIQAFTEFADSLSGDKNCLKKTGKKLYNLSSLKNLGAKYSMDEQCRQNLGPKSFFCSEGSNSDEGKCATMLCYENKLSGCMQTLNGRALDGTPCGKNKWCMDRKCVHNPQAKSQKAYCLHGDKYGKIAIKNAPSKSCSELKKGCRHPAVKNKCCATCAKK